MHRVQHALEPHTQNLCMHRNMLPEVLRAKCVSIGAARSVASVVSTYLVAHEVALSHARHRAHVHVQVAAADGRRRHLYDRILGISNHWHQPIGVDCHRLLAGPLGAEHLPVLIVLGLERDLAQTLVRLIAHLHMTRSHV